MKLQQQKAETDFEAICGVKQGGDGQERLAEKEFLLESYKEKQQLGVSGFDL